jgi:hypothetical protein
MQEGGGGGGWGEVIKSHGQKLTLQGNVILGRENGI